MRYAIPTILLLAVVFGCASKSPSQSMQLLYVSTFDTLADAREAGLISPDEFRQVVVPASRAAQDAIDAAKAAQERGDNAVLQAAVAAFNRALLEVEALRQKAEAAQPRQRGALDVLGVLLIISKLLETATKLLPLAGKIGSGQELTAEEQAMLDAEQRRVSDRVEELGRQDD